MPSRYWIKFYIEVLDDPKMGRLSDRLWRRACELFLVAGEAHNGGSLPTFEDMAWRLRLTSEELSEDLDQLAELGILKHNDGCWHVANFSKRQAPSTDAERQRQSRERKRMSQYHGEEGVTNCDNAVTDNATEQVTTCDVDTDTDTESDTDKRSCGDSPQPPPKPPEPVPKPEKPNNPPMTDGLRHFLDAFGRKRFATIVQKQALADCERDVGTSVFREVVDWAARNNIRKTDAIITAAKRWGKKKIKRRPGALGQFTDAELEEARRDSLAEEPIDAAAFLGEGT